MHGVLGAAFLRAIPSRSKSWAPSSSVAQHGCLAIAPCLPMPEEEPSIARQEAEQLGAESTREASASNPVSVSRDEAEDRVNLCRSWVFSGAFEDDLLACRVHYGPAEALVLQQLAVPGGCLGGELAKAELITASTERAKAETRDDTRSTCKHMEQCWLKHRHGLRPECAQKAERMCCLPWHRAKLRNQRFGWLVVSL